MNLINLNTAQTDELTNLPGVGPALAVRIINARPFEKMDDLSQVSGVGPALLERLEPLIRLADPEPSEEVLALYEENEPEFEGDEAPFETDPQLEVAAEVEAASSDSSTELDDEESPEIDLQPGEDTGESMLETEADSQRFEEIIPREKAIVPVPKEETKEKTGKPAPKPVTRTQIFLIAAACSFAAFILAILLSIGIIGGINNGLTFASPEQVQKLSSQVNGVNDQLGMITDDIDSIRTRLDNLDGISGRVGDLESEVETLSTELDATAETVTEINNQITEINSQIEEIRSSTEKFQAFLDGLRNLLETMPASPVEETP